MHTEYFLLIGVPLASAARAGVPFAVLILNGYVDQKAFEKPISGWMFTRVKAVTITDATGIFSDIALRHILTGMLGLDEHIHPHVYET